MKTLGMYLLTAILCGGCIHQVGGRGAYDGVSATHPDSSLALAAHAAEQLAVAYPPGHTALSVDTDNNFGKHLENALRRKGFTLSPNGLPVEYNADLLRGEASPACYLRLSLPGGVSISQMYALDNGMVAPAGNLIKTGLPDFTAPAPMPVVVPNLDIDPAGMQVENRLPHMPLTASAGAQSPLPSLAGMTPVQATPLQEEPSAVQEALSAPVTASATAQPEPVHETGIPAVVSSDGWTITPGMLRGQLEFWALQGGYQLVWKARHDFEMQSQAVFRDDFVGAVKRLFARMHLHGNPLRATIYQDNKVLEVVEE